MEKWHRVSRVSGDVWGLVALLHHSEVDFRSVVAWKVGQIVEPPPASFAGDPDSLFFGGDGCPSSQFRSHRFRVARNHAAGYVTSRPIKEKQSKFHGGFSMDRPDVECGLMGAIRIQRADDDA